MCFVCAGVCMCARNHHVSQILCDCQPLLWSAQGRSISRHAIAYQWRPPPRVRRHRASKPQGSLSNKCCLRQPVSRDQIIRRERIQGNKYFPCSVDHEQDWQQYPVDPYFTISDDDTYIYLGNHVDQIMHAPLFPYPLLLQRACAVERKCKKLDFEHIKIGAHLCQDHGRLLRPAVGAIGDVVEYDVVGDSQHVLAEFFALLQLVPEAAVTTFDGITPLSNLTASPSAIGSSTGLRYGANAFQCAMYF